MKSNAVVPFLAVLLTLSGSLRAAAADPSQFSYPPAASLEQVQQRIERAPKDHPRLIATREDFAKLRQATHGDPTRRMLARAVVEQAEELLRVEPIVRTLEGRRLLDKSRRCVKRVLVLATAFHLTGDARFAKRCEKEMVTAADFEDWNPSHFLDVGEMTLALAIGYDWLYDQLDASAREDSRCDRKERSGSAVRDAA